MLCLTFQQSRGNVYSSTSALNYTCKLGISENNTIILVPLTGHSMNHSQISILIFRTIYAIKKTSHFSSSAITHVIHLKRRYYLYHKNLAKKVKHILLREGSPFFFSFTVCPCLKCKINPETLAILNVWNAVAEQRAFYTHGQKCYKSLLPKNAKLISLELRR